MTATVCSPAILALVQSARPKLVETLTVAEGAGADTLALATWLVEQGGPWPEPARSVIEANMALQRDPAASNAQWRAARREALALGESDDPQVRHGGAVAEALGWPLSDTVAGLSELYRGVVRKLSEQASRGTGWTPEAEQEARRIMDGIKAKSDAGESGGKTMPEMFRETAPEMEQRFSAQLAAANEAHQAFAEAAVARALAE